MTEEQSCAGTQERRDLEACENAQTPMQQASYGCRQMAAEHGVAAVNALAHVMMSSNSDSARVTAAIAILDRAFGKPAQAITGEDGGPVELSVVSRLGGLSYFELKALISDPDSKGIE